MSCLPCCQENPGGNSNSPPQSAGMITNVVHYSLKLPEGVTVNRNLSQVFGEVEKQMKMQKRMKIMERRYSYDGTTKTFIICPVSSRLGSNAAEAMKGVNGGKSMALLLIHSQARHVPFNRPSNEILTDEPYCSLGAIVDVLTTPMEGFYNCPVNDEAVYKICDFLSRPCVGAANELTGN